MAIVLPLNEIQVFKKNKLPNATTDYRMGAMFLLNKPKGWSSFDVVKFLRTRIGVKKVGHAGTLDPMATGLLIVCSGKATKSISLLQDLPKTYKGEITFGSSTDSYDAEGKLTAEAQWKHITQEHIETALDEHFSGVIEQIPPMFSALKYGGKKLYDLARKGQEVKRYPRQVIIYGHTVINYDPPKLRIEIKCSKGTYIRSIAHDLGEILDSKGFLSELERTAIGQYSVDDALTPHEIGDWLEKDG